MEREDVLKAFARYDSGVRPNHYGRPRSWFIQADNGQLYPLKIIYALAANIDANQFHTQDAVAAIRRLEFNIVDVDAMIKNQTADETKFNKAVSRSLNGSDDERNERLRNAPQRAQERYVMQRVYDRNPDVVAAVLCRARGICERCNNEAPFLRRTNNEPYLEVHHINQLADGGEDTVDNAIAVCPNCHREAHYGAQ